MKLWSTCVFLVLMLLPASAMATPRPVSSEQVMQMLLKLNSSEAKTQGYIHISEAIAKASNEDPLFPEEEEGSEITATLLVAVAWHESAFAVGAVGNHGKSFGLYQIQPLSGRANAKVLTKAKEASFIAVGLIRQSVQYCLSRGRDWVEVLAWYAASSPYGAKHPKIIAQSKKRMETASALFAEFFGSGELFGYLLSRKSST